MKADDAKECLCSALAVNCFQPGCCLHDRCVRQDGARAAPRVRSRPPRLDHEADGRGAGEAAEEYVPTAPPPLSRRTTKDLVLPGAHQSSSATIPRCKPFAAVGICQRASAYEQLRRGARYVDLRVGGTLDSASAEEAFVVHGPLKGGWFPDVVEEVHHFLVDNPGEFVVVQVRCEARRHPMSSRQLLGVLEWLSSTFTSEVTREDVDSWFRLRHLTLGELAGRRKNVLLLVNRDMFDFVHEGVQYDSDVAARQFGCHYDESFTRTEWCDTDDVATLLERNLRFSEEAGRSERDKFVVSQAMLTPQPPRGLGGAIDLLLGLRTLRVASLAREAYERDALEAFLRDHAEGGWNVVLLDFVDLCPQLVRFLIGLNSPKTLTVESASASSEEYGGVAVDVTEAIESLIRRNCCLFLLDFREDLNLSTDEGVLTLTYRFDDEEAFEAKVPFDRDTEYLLCDA
ncbi:hypothetical protein ACHAWF_007951 [Thalassiosira exigua]